jgi:cytochrome c-type biogenesis protein CcmE
MAEQTAAGASLDIRDESSGISRKVKFLTIAFVLIGAMVYFGFMTFQSATVYYYTPTEIKSIGPTPDGKIVRVSGSLVPESFHRAAGSTTASFRLTDGEQDVLAAHDGVLPDLFFNEHSEIILEGRLGADGSFDSQNIIVKCPSKYVGEEVTPPEGYDSYGKPNAAE